MKYSKPCRVSGKLYRYNYDRCLVEYITQPTAEMIADNEEWRKEFNKDLWNIVDGYVVIESVGLSVENWKNKESRNEYLTMWGYELDEENAYLLDQYMKYG